MGEHDTLNSSFNFKLVQLLVALYEETRRDEISSSLSHSRDLRFMCFMCIVHFMTSVASAIGSSIELAMGWLWSSDASARLLTVHGHDVRPLTSLLRPLRSFAFCPIEFPPLHSHRVYVARYSAPVLLARHFPLSPKHLFTQPHTMSENNAGAIDPAVSTQG